MSSGGWEACLDALGRHLRGQRQALAAGRIDEIDPFPVPAGLGALPSHLRSRARSLAREGRDLETELTAALAISARHITIVAVLQQTTPGPAVFVDRRC